MTKYFLMLLVGFLTLSCSKKVEFTGNVAGGSPLERIEFIEAAGVATLPLTNVGVDAKGNFSGAFEAPRDGMYLMTYGGKQGMIFVKGGQKLNISGQAATFPMQFTVTGDAKKDNDFLREVENKIKDYAANINLGDMVAKKEDAFLKSVEKIHADLEKRIDQAAKQTSAGSDVVQWKKDELEASVLGLMAQYEMHHPQVANDPNYKISKKFQEMEAGLQKNKERMLKNQPLYRNYLLGKLNKDFMEFGQKKSQAGQQQPSSVLFSEFLDSRKELSDLEKDYLLAYIIASGDISPSTSPEDKAKVQKIIQEKIKNAEIKKDLERIQFVIDGPATGKPAPGGKLVTAEGKDFSLSAQRAKPALVIFYASWNPYISEMTIPVLKEVHEFYNSKLDFVYVNMDDSKEQFVKTSKALLQGLSGTQVYAEGGINSSFAKDWGLYGFKLPSFIIIDKAGNVASKTFYNLGDPDLVQVLEKQTGLKAPEVEQSPEIKLQNDWADAPAVQTP